MNGRTRSALYEAFPGKEVAEEKPTGPSWNDKNETVCVEFADGETVFLKTAADGSGARVAREETVIDYVGANTDVPVPTVVASDPDAEVPYLATAPVDGPNLIESWGEGDEKTREELARQVGRSLADLHDRRFDEHGHVVGGGPDGLELDAGSWTQILADRVEFMRDLASADRFDHHFDEVRAAVEANRDLLDDAPAALLHGDPAQPNCFCAEDETETETKIESETETGAETESESGTRIETETQPNERIGLLDWEITYVGDPARELVRARNQLFGSLRDDGPDRLAEALHEGYRERAGSLPEGFEDRRPIYEAVRFLGTSGYYDKWLDLADEEPDELADWMADEMDRRLTRIT